MPLPESEEDKRNVGAVLNHRKLSPDRKLNRPIQKNKLSHSVLPDLNHKLSKSYEMENAELVPPRKVKSRSNQLIRVSILKNSSLTIEDQSPSR